MCSLTNLEIILAPIFLCWGSFINMLSYRLISQESLSIPRSFCPKCKKTIKPYDLIPVLSWVILKGKCRNCHKSISPLYPFIELLTLVVFELLIIFVAPHFWFSYFIFFTALLVTIRSDLESMLISRMATLYLLPFSFSLAAFGYLEIGLLESILASVVGYLTFWVIKKLFYYYRNLEGMGDGDLELAALIGSLLGRYGLFMSIFIGSLTGSILGLTLIATKLAKRETALPFGLFLALGAIIFVLFKSYLNFIILIS